MDNARASDVKDPQAQRGLSRRRFLRWAGWSGAALAMAPLLQACAIATTTRRFAVKITGPEVVAFDPAVLTVPLGATVVWKNQDINPHSVTCDPALIPQDGPQSLTLLPPGAEPWDSGNLYKGQSWSHTFDVAGEYVYFSRGQGAFENLIGNISVTE